MVLLDIDMPRLKGTEVLKHLHDNPPGPHLKIMMLSGRASGDEMARMLASGASDYMAKPYSVLQLLSRVQAALQLKSAQDRSDLLSRHLLTINLALEKNLHARDIDLVHARNALVLSLAELVARRDVETGAHLIRLQHYSRRLAEEAAVLPAFASQIDLPFIAMLECCAPLHDIGKAGVPDSVLLKPGKLTPEERVIMQSHTTIGAAVLHKARTIYPSAVAFFQMAIDIARHHHERYDGAGYPDRLIGDAIPLAARILALADVYDALRSQRCYKPALPHAQALETMTQTAHGHFDPLLFQAFLRCAPRLDQIFTEFANDDTV
jgi:response regulator RpfG family c-di-GMP phosphodiesterase